MQKKKIWGCKIETEVHFTFLWELYFLLKTFNLIVLLIFKKWKILNANLDICSSSWHEFLIYIRAFSSYSSNLWMEVTRSVTNLNQTMKTFMVNLDNEHRKELINTISNLSYDLQVDMLWLHIRRLKTEMLIFYLTAMYD